MHLLKLNPTHNLNKQEFSTYSAAGFFSFSVAFANTVSSLPRGDRPNVTTGSRYLSDLSVHVNIWSPPSYKTYASTHRWSNAILKKKKKQTKKLISIL